MAENLKWDHTVIDVNDLESAIKWFKNLGITFHNGGVHEKWGTKNAVGYFGLNYLELMAVDNPDVANQVKRDDATSIYDAIHDAPGQHTNTIGLRTNDIQAVHDRLESQNFPVEDIQTGTRINPEGKEITWKIFFIRNKMFEVAYPYIVQWNEPDYIRKEDLIKDNLLVPHDSGEVVVKQAVYDVTNPEIVAIKWGQIIGLTPVRKGKQWSIDFGDRQLIFRSGQENRITELVFGESGDLAGKVYDFGETKLAFE